MKIETDARYRSSECRVSPHRLKKKTSHNRPFFVSGTLLLASAAFAATPTVDIKPGAVILGEDVGTTNFKLQLSSPHTQKVTVNYATREANATNAATPGADFVEVATSVAIPAGSTSATVSIDIVDDSKTESTERFQVFLSGATNANIGRKVSFVDILDNDSNDSGNSAAADIVSPGKYAYLDDVDPIATPSGSGPDPMQGLGWPRVGIADSPISQSVEQLTKYRMIAAQNMTKVGKVQKINPDVIYLRIINPVEFQPAVKYKMPFGGTGNATRGSNVYAGHWLYKPGTRLAKAISASTTSISVQDASKFEAGSYAVIYDAPAGSFNNAEHVKISSVNKSTDTLTIKTRGYKSSATSHSNGSIIAQHVTGAGQKANSDNWVYNQSTACPTDSRGNTFGEALVDWLANNYDRLNNGNRVDVRVDGFHFDTDEYYMLSSKGADVDNDLIEDLGVNGNGFNMWGEGLNDFYADLRSALPSFLIVGGSPGTRGWEDLNGIQMEGFPLKNDFFSPQPKYVDVDSRLANYGLHARNHAVGPSLTMALSKSPTNLYPHLEPAHRLDADVPIPPNNRAFRFSFGLSLLDDGWYGQPSSGKHDDVWWDEYAVDVVKGSSTFGRAMASNPYNESKIRKHLGWMGMPIGERVRIYNETAFAKSNSQINNGGFDSNLSGWSANNVTISADSNAANRVEGSRALRISKHKSYALKPSGAQVLGPTLSLQKGVDYTLVFAAKAAQPRQITVAVGSSNYQTFQLPDRWVRRVMSFTATQTGNHRIKFQVGKDNAVVWLDAIYLFKGNASVFQRDFENARVVVNATGNSRTVNLGGTFKRIKGTGQDPINNGASVNSVTVAPHDAAILVRP